jgi:hypothetical protein
MFREVLKSLAIPCLILASWFQLAVSGSPAAWNVLGRIFLAIIH